MSLLDDLKPAGAQAPAGAGDPKKKRQQRIMLAVGAGAILALIFLMTRRQTAAQPGLTTVGDPTAAPPGSTFADNGSSMSEFASTVGGALGEVTRSNDDVAGAIDRNTGGLGDLGDLIRGLPSTPISDGTTPSTTGTNSGQQTGGTTTAQKDAKKTPPDEFGRTAADRASIRAERTKGQEDRRGWTPTEIALAKKNPKYKTTLEARANREAKAAKKPLPFPAKKPDAKKPPKTPTKPGKTGGTPAHPASHAGLGGQTVPARLALSQDAVSSILQASAGGASAGQIESFLHFAPGTVQPILAAGQGGASAQQISTYINTAASGSPSRAPAGSAKPPAKKPPSKSKKK